MWKLMTAHPIQSEVRHNIQHFISQKPRLNTYLHILLQHFSYRDEQFDETEKAWINVLTFEREMLDTSNDCEDT